MPYRFSGHIERLELIDFDADGTEEIIVMFNTHGNGGNGTHELYVLWIEEDKSIISSGPIMYTEITEASGADIGEETRIDTIYYIQKVEYEGKMRLQTHQNIWENTHANSVEDLICIVSLEKGSSSLVAEKAWISEDSIPDIFGRTRFRHQILG